jgi:DNA-directed RNA polymerase subunit M/transcription elongation factor TFIIS
MSKVSIFCRDCGDFLYMDDDDRLAICPACQVAIEDAMDELDGVDFTAEERRSAAYTVSGGTACPHCNSANITGGQVNIAAGRAEQEVTCGSCHRAWTAVYELIGIEEIES